MSYKNNYSPLIQSQVDYVKKLEREPFRCVICNEVSKRDGMNDQPCQHCGTRHDFDFLLFGGHSARLTESEKARHLLLTPNFLEEEA